MGIQELAVALHGEGKNCAQCVLTACSGYTGLDRETSLAVSGGFGGGVRCGEICGAISGAVMAIGAAEKNTDADTRAAANRVAAKTKKCTASFKDKFGFLRCADLKRSGVSCDDLIAFGAETAEKIINDKME